MFKLLNICKNCFNFNLEVEFHFVSLEASFQLPPVAGNLGSLKGAVSPFLFFFFGGVVFFNSRDYVIWLGSLDYSGLYVQFTLHYALCVESEDKWFCCVTEQVGFHKHNCYDLMFLK